jgi:hypothetical protein
MAADPRPIPADVEVSHPVPAEVAVRRGRAALLRPRLEPEAWLAWQSVPEW